MPTPGRPARGPGRGVRVLRCRHAGLLRRLRPHPGANTSAFVRRCSGLEPDDQAFGAGSRLGAEARSSIPRIARSRSTGSWCRSTILWGLVNLLPIWPLDGGQATQIRPLAGRTARTGVDGTTSLPARCGGLLAILVFTGHPDHFHHRSSSALRRDQFPVSQSIHRPRRWASIDDDWWRSESTAAESHPDLHPSSRPHALHSRSVSRGSFSRTLLRGASTKLSDLRALA